MNCFKKAGITSEVQRAAIVDSDDLFKDFRESLDALKADDSDMVPEGLSTENFIEEDHDPFAIAPCITEEDILEQFQTHQEESDEDKNDCGDKSVKYVAPKLPLRLAVESALDVLKNAALYKTTVDEM